MKKYEVLLNCNGFKVVTVEAQNKEEAKELAMSKMSHSDHGEYEFGEFLSIEKITH
jgi:hypothetical protein